MREEVLVVRAGFPHRAKHLVVSGVDLVFGERRRHAPVNGFCGHGHISRRWLVAGSRSTGNTTGNELKSIAPNAATAHGEGHHVKCAETCTAGTCVPPNGMVIALL